MKKSLSFLFSLSLLLRLAADDLTTVTLTYENLLEREVIQERENAENMLDKPYVVMLTFDGFRYDYAERYGAKNLLTMRENGSSVKRLIPSFPSKTFPNHYTIATGLYPAHHGIVSNTFYSREKKAIYQIGDRDAVEDGSWYGGVPIWVLAEQQGMLSASFYWVGSEADVRGIHPTYYFPFDSQVPYAFRVQRALDWLSLPEPKRPHMITLYFSLTDTIGHRFGPDSSEIKEAVLTVDEQIGNLREGLKKTGLPVTLIVTSDHGMTEATHFININDLVDLKDSRFNGGPTAMIYTSNEAETECLFNELSKIDLFETYLANAVPTYLNYQNRDRIGDIVLIASAPIVINQWQDEEPYYNSMIGNHGYDPFTHTDMGGIFYAEGPLIRKGLGLAPTENIHIYPFLASLLGLKISEPIDGCLDALQPMITESD